MREMNRRQFLKRLAAITGGIPFAHLPLPVYEEPPLRDPPTPLGRIATWHNQVVRSLALESADIAQYLGYDDVIPLYGTVIGEAPWPRNPIWYLTDGGYVHSGYVQLVENNPSEDTITRVREPGFWAQVCVPIAEARWRPGVERVSRKLYYGTVYRVVSAERDDEGAWWYQIQEGYTLSPGPYVLARSLHPLPEEELSPISPGQSDKWIEIDLREQLMTCYEGNDAVFSSGVSSGASGTSTPRGEYRVLRKRHTSRMVGDDYDLPGVAFPTYFTHSAIAIHGTYWHNDFVQPHSHGCVNVPSEVAQWVFRWTDPAMPYEDFNMVVPRDAEATRIVVI
jgi:hypothetical protein